MNVWKRCVFLIVALFLIFPLFSFAKSAGAGGQIGNDMLGNLETLEDTQAYFNIGSETSLSVLSSFGGRSANIIINLSNETIYWDSAPDEGEEPAFVSFDNGRKWKSLNFTIGESDASPGDFSKFLNKESIILLTTALGDDKQPRKAMPAQDDLPAIEAAIVYSFPKINARPKLDKFTIDYLTYAHDGEDGEWTLKGGGSQKVSDLQIAYTVDMKTPIDGRYGKFPLKEGLNIVEPSIKPGEKIAFIIRLSPTANSAGSKPRRIRVSTLVKPPNLKVNYKKNLIKFKPGMVYSNAGTQGAFTNKPTAVGSKEVTVGLSITIDETSATHFVRKVATETKPASLVQEVIVAARTPVNETMAVAKVRKTKIKLPNAYEACLWSDRNREGVKWKNSITAESSGVYAVRAKNNARYNAKDGSTRGKTISGNLILDVYATRDEKGKTVLTATYIGSKDGEATASNITQAVYVPARDLNLLAKASDNKISADVGFNYEVKGSYFGQQVRVDVAGVNSLINNKASLVDTLICYAIPISASAVYTVLSANEEVKADGSITINFYSSDESIADRTFYAPTINIDVTGYKTPVDES